MAPDAAAALAKLGQREDFVSDEDLVFARLSGSYLNGSALRRRVPRVAVARPKTPLQPIRLVRGIPLGDPAEPELGSLPIPHPLAYLASIFGQELIEVG